MTGPPAHRGPDGRFFNPWTESPEHRLSAFLRWRVERITQGIAAPPPGALPRVAPRLERRAAAHALTATWVGHSTVVIQIGGLNVLTDPIWSERCSPVQWAGPRRLTPPAVPFDALPPIDIVLLSHAHYDHLDAPTVRALTARHPRAVWLAPLGLAALLRRLGAAAVHELDWWDEVTVGDAAAACVPARHFSARTPRDVRRSLWCGWTLRVGPRAVYFAGDTGFHPEFGSIGARFGPFDLSLLPIGAYAPRWFMRPVHMDPAEAVQAFRDVRGSGRDGPRTMAMGIHWGTFQLADEPWDEPPALMASAWTAAGLERRDLWIPKHGETREAGSGED